MRQDVSQKTFTAGCSIHGTYLEGDLKFYLTRKNVYLVDTADMWCPGDAELSNDCRHIPGGWKVWME